MHRAFRASRVLPLHPITAPRSRLASTLTQNDHIDAHEQSTSRGIRAKSSPVASRTPAQQMESAMKQECLPYLRGNGQNRVAGCRDLVDVRQVMEIYRRHRDLSSSPVPASDAVHLILTTVRQRMVTLRSVISSVRTKIIDQQNGELQEYLVEIVNDVATKKAYMSSFALAYLFTALGSMGRYAAAMSAWKLLSGDGDHPSTPHVSDPRVVGAALMASDPAVITLEDVESTYEATAAKHGRHVLLDDALARSYLRFHEYSKAAQLYIDMCEKYDPSEWEQTLSRLHNQILTDCTDIVIADKFFSAALEPSSFVSLHPGAATAYARHKWNSTKSADSVIQVYRDAVARLTTQESRTVTSARHYNNLTTECTRLILESSPHDSPEGRRSLLRLIETATESGRSGSEATTLAMNTALSCVAKQWPTSPFIRELQLLLEATDAAQNRVDTLRVLLTSSRYVDVPAERLAVWWQHRVNLKTPLEVFDWIALARGADHASRTAVFVEAFTAVKPQLPQWAYTQISLLPVLAEASRVEGIEIAGPTGNSERAQQNEQLSDAAVEASLQTAKSLS